MAKKLLGLLVLLALIAGGAFVAMKMMDKPEPEPTPQPAAAPTPAPVAARMRARRRPGADFDGIRAMSSPLGGGIAAVAALQ